MAIVPTPLALNLIRQFRGTLDFYYWKNLGVCRKWPRRAQQPNSAAQLTARSNLKRMHEIMHALPPTWHESWNNVSLPSGRSATDLKRKHVLWLMHADRWTEPPTITGSLYQSTPGSTTGKIYLTHAPMQTPSDAENVEWLYKVCTAEGERFSYEDYAPAKTREHYYYYQTQPHLEDYRLPLSVSYSASSRLWTLTIPATDKPLSICARPQI